MREQVVSVALDACGLKLWKTLATGEMLPNLRFISLDTTHIKMKYMSAHGRKSSEGSAWLGRIMAKLDKVDNTRNNVRWGAPYCGSDYRPYNDAE